MCLSPFQKTVWEEHNATRMVPMQWTKAFKSTWEESLLKSKLMKMYWAPWKPISAGKHAHLLMSIQICLSSYWRPGKMQGYRMVLIYGADLMNVEKVLPTILKRIKQKRQLFVKCHFKKWVLIKSKSNIESRFTFGCFQHSWEVQLRS